MYYVIERSICNTEFGLLYIIADFECSEFVRSVFANLVVLYAYVVIVQQLLAIYSCCLCAPVTGCFIYDLSGAYELLYFYA